MGMRVVDGLVDGFGLDLLWIPLGAGGWFVQFNGRVWEMCQARRQHRRPSALYHTALVLHLPEGRFVVENAWPIPNEAGAARGVVVEGPVFSTRLAGFRTFRYEVRCWKNGVIADAAYAVGGPQRISGDPAVGRRVLQVLRFMPPRVWGRRVDGCDDMWNSNSTIAWALTRSGVAADGLRPPDGGRAPGWRAGVLTAHREEDLAQTRT